MSAPAPTRGATLAPFIKKSPRNIPLNDWCYNSSFLAWSWVEFVFLKGHCKLMRVTFGTLNAIENWKKNQASLNLIVFFQILTQNILLWVIKIKCRKLNHVSKYIRFMCWIFFITMSNFIFSNSHFFYRKIIRYMFLWVQPLRS